MTQANGATAPRPMDAAAKPAVTCKPGSMSPVRCVAVDSAVSRIARRENAAQLSRGSLRTAGPRSQAALVCGLAGVRPIDGDQVSLVGAFRVGRGLRELLDRRCAIRVSALREAIGTDRTDATRWPAAEGAAADPHTMPALPPHLG
jgi:hypothetical protein